ncbi:Cobalt-zinc-cadmium resistance protein CzcC [Castellaniella defragrans]
MLHSLHVPALLRGTTRVRALCALLMLASTAAYGGQSGGLTLEAALAQATHRSAAIQASQFAERADTHAAVEAGQLPDPMLDVGVDNLPINGPQRYSLTQDFMTARHIGIEQEWVSTDKRERRTALADRKIDKARATTLIRLVDTRRQTALAWLDAAYAQQALDLSQALVHHMTDELGATRASYRGVQASAKDVTQAEIMLSQAKDRLLEAQQTSRVALIALGRWVASPVSKITGGIPPLKSRVASLAPQTLERVQPELLAAARDISVADAGTSVATSNRTPNWTWSVTYQQRGSQYSNMVSVGVKIPLPVSRQNRQDQDVAEKAALGNQARFALREAEREVVANIQALAASLENGRARVAQLKETLLPAATQQLGLATAAYKGGTGALGSVFDARRSLLEAQLQVVDLEREVARTWAQLEYQVIPQDSALDR